MTEEGGNKEGFGWSVGGGGAELGACMGFWWGFGGGSALAGYGLCGIDVYWHVLGR